MSAKPVSNRQIRKAVNSQADYLGQHHAALEKLLPAVGELQQQIDALEAFRDMTIMQRLRWLVRGYGG